MMWRSCGRERRCEWRRNISRILPRVELDESLCEQAFVNLIQNAYDAMGADGGGTVARQSEHRTGQHPRSRECGWSGSAHR